MVHVLQVIQGAVSEQRSTSRSSRETAQLVTIKRKDFNMKTIKLTDEEYYVLRDVLEMVATKSLKTPDLKGFLGKCEINIHTQRMFDIIYDTYMKVRVANFRSANELRG